MKAVLSQEAVVAAVRDSGLDQKTPHTILRQHGADRVSELDPREYASVLAALNAARTTAAASDAERCLTAGYDIISVIPPDAPLSPSSTITPSQRGKTPGVRRDDGLWTGYGWRANTATVEDARAWHTAGASIGIKTGAVVGLDIDATDVDLSAALCDLARATLGPAPCRIGRPPKALLVYRTTEPRPKQKLYIARGTEHHAIEALGIGQQFVAHGIHPGTRRPYAWDGDGLPAVDALPVVSAAQLDAYLEAAARLCEARGYATRRDGAAATHEVSSVSQASLQAPTLDLLRNVVRHIPNTESRFPLRDDFLKVACAIAAAAGDDREAGHGIFQEWAAAYDGAGGNDPEYVENTYRSLKPPFRVGYNWLCELAREHGFNDAALDFGDATGTAPNPAESNDDAPPGARAGLERFNRAYAMIGGTIWRMPKRGKPYPIRTQAWRDHTANQYAATDDGKSVKLSQLWLGWRGRRTYNRVVFDPAQSPLAGVPSSDGEGEDFNLWPGFATMPSTDGSCDLFLAHLRDVVANGDETAYRWVLQWLASIVQDPARRSGTALVLRGRQGAGKSAVGAVMRRLIGDPLHVLLDKPEAVVGKFNAHFEGRLLAQVEEAVFAGDPRQIGPLKHLITSDELMIERKGVDSVPLPNYVRVLMTSNSDWVVPAGESERRFTVLDVSSAHAHEAAYHDAMHAQLNAGGYDRLMHHLLHVEIDWDFIGRPLANAALRDQQLATLAPELRWWLDVLTEGHLPGDVSGAGTADADDLFANYSAALRGHYDRPTRERLGRFVRSVGGQRVRSTEGSRPWQYQLPPLGECRAALASRLAVAPDWPDGTAAWAPIDALVGGAA